MEAAACQACAATSQERVRAFAPIVVCHIVAPWVFAPARAVPVELLASAVAGAAVAYGYQGELEPLESGVEVTRLALLRRVRPVRAAEPRRLDAADVLRAAIEVRGDVPNGLISYWQHACDAIGCIYDTAVARVTDFSGGEAENGPLQPLALQLTCEILFDRKHRLALRALGMQSCEAPLDDPAALHTLLGGAARVAGYLAATGALRGVRRDAPAALACVYTALAPPLGPSREAFAENRAAVLANLRASAEVLAAFQGDCPSACCDEDCAGRAEAMLARWEDVRGDNAGSGALPGPLRSLPPLKLMLGTQGWGTLIDAYPRAFRVVLHLEGGDRGTLGEEPVSDGAPGWPALLEACTPRGEALEADAIAREWGATSLERAGRSLPELYADLYDGPCEEGAETSSSPAAITFLRGSVDTQSVGRARGATIPVDPLDVRYRHVALCVGDARVLWQNVVDGSVLEVPTDVSPHLRADSLVQMEVLSACGIPVDCNVGCAHGSDLPACDSTSEGSPSTVSGATSGRDPSLGKPSQTAIVTASGVDPTPETHLGSSSLPNATRGPTYKTDQSSNASETVAALVRCSSFELLIRPESVRAAVTQSAEWLLSQRTVWTPPKPCAWPCPVRRAHAEDALFSALRPALRRLTMWRPARPLRALGLLLQELLDDPKGPGLDTLTPGELRDLLSRLPPGH